MALVCGFPNNENDIHHKKAMECVVQALAAHQENGGRVEKGKHVQHLDVLCSILSGLWSC